MCARACARAHVAARRRRGVCTVAREGYPASARAYPAIPRSCALIAARASTRQAVRPAALLEPKPAETVPARDARCLLFFVFCLLFSGFSILDSVCCLMSSWFLVSRHWRGRGRRFRGVTGIHSLDLGSFLTQLPFCFLFVKKKKSASASSASSAAPVAVTVPSFQMIRYEDVEFPAKYWRSISPEGKGRPLPPPPPPGPLCPRLKY